jgi:hypothetical protein
MAQSDGVDSDKSCFSSENDTYALGALRGVISWVGFLLGNYLSTCVGNVLHAGGYISLSLVFLKKSTMLGRIETPFIQWVEEALEISCPTS